MKCLKSQNIFNILFLIGLNKIVSCLNTLQEPYKYNFDIKQ